MEGNTFDIQGHRGCRGLMPENTIPAFIHAVSLGVTTLELDVVISKDNKVVISHEPWMNPEICTDESGNAISGNGMQFNFLEMPYSQISKFDCGLKSHPRFPNQQKIPARKPLLIDMIVAVEKYIAEKKLPAIRYNIETKCLPQGDNLFHPAPEMFCELLLQVLEKSEILHRCTIQSFDYRTLQIINKKQTTTSIAMLVDEQDNVEKKLAELGFTPNVCSPHYSLINSDLIRFCSTNTTKLIPWTVNNVDDMIRLKAEGVDGLITDYPDVAINNLRN